MSTKSSSSSTGSPGYYSGNTASYDNSIGNYLFGGLNNNGSVPGGTGSLLNGGATGGYLGDLSGKAGTNQVYNGSGSGFTSPTYNFDTPYSTASTYNPSSYTPFNFNPVQQQGATLSPGYVQGQQNLIAEQGNQERTATDQANADRNAYAGSGSTNITNYENANTDRNINSNISQENQALQGQTQQEQFQSQEQVNAANQTAGNEAQYNQANQNLSGATLDEQQQEYGSTFQNSMNQFLAQLKQGGAEAAGQLNSNNNQFGTTSNLNYLSGKEGEQQANTGNLQQLLAILNQYQQGNAQKPTTSSSSSSTGIGPSSIGLSFPA